ncbi:hypothetical protein PF005_g13 [Phytophthora fragariae]|uniref:Integrase catalytic domain-containing protein n=1 Tax=Phytophthora fragariae TaxID=53985 RepID=A0A6A3KTA3_9STRA|nr:hypothetical protein PF003_g5734 [Phytophthora fragariae]KAE8950462.1 hypothetical protein PF009_g13 [Phytophthora fragariae]KAE9008505.1 hypothetical protein PF011_g10687 [Phytophthora fragariae]KAE9121225.1 hypothetical protein PF010_g7196 [Phytophthora fragariae]KAE9141632.1 hypothetical protein PF007_g119 [Phytophthora fragariae]
MDLYTKAYVQSCKSCMMSKSCTGRKTGKIQPILLPAVCWGVVLTDFITRLPVLTIMVVVDKLLKRPVYTPTHITATVEDTAKLFFNNVIRYYEIPSTIISNGEVYGKILDSTGEPNEDQTGDDNCPPSSSRRSN